MDHNLQRLLQAERLATVSRFASQIAHEIRNPLNSISLNFELLEDELDPASENGRGLIRSVLREQDRLNVIVSEYLQFSGVLKPHMQRGRIDSVIQAVVESFEPPPRIEFRVCEAESTPEISFDTKLLRHVLDNLLRNAAEAIEGPGTIDLETEVIDRFVVIRVRDSGVGIPVDAQSRLFEPFFTTKANGTGLGLATSQQIMFEHDGHVLLESQPGQGSTFSLMLPV
jgi:two-component system sensor histidine kinase PilS (NtrC family)